jgi:hypothetical protein
MKSRGRKSAAELSTLAAIVDRRPAPPGDLNDAQAKTWRAVVGTRPTGWFGPDTYPLLAAYCRHVWHAEQIDRLIASRFEDDCDPEKRGELPELLKARERESRVMLALARSMRITQQATYHPEKGAGTRPPETKPWEGYGRD